MMYTLFMNQMTSTNIIFKGYCKFRTLSNLSAEIRKSVTIDNISKEIKFPKTIEYVPRKYLMKSSSNETLKHLKWMLQKDILSQDMFLMGPPGSRKRNLAMAFLELTDREVEFIAISHDTTEADLKQRKEIKNGTVNYYDQSAVRAAVNGRILILEGIEKAERNVLPILNNLLENREMHLEDGRLLIPALRYDKLLKEHNQQELDAWRLVRVSEDFRVIALGLPVPRYPGYPLDPPLRSRFQARHIPFSTYKEQLIELQNLAPHVNRTSLSQLLSCCRALDSEEAVALGLPNFPVDNLFSLAVILNDFPNIPLYHLFYRLYPYKLFLNKEGRFAVEDILKSFGVLDNDVAHNSKSYNFVENIHATIGFVEISVNYGDKDSAVIKLPRGPGISKIATTFSYIETNYQNSLIAEIMQSQSNLDVCLIGPKGCGKSIIIQRLTELLDCQVEHIMLFQDMTSRDLIQYRTTLSNGDTIWKDSPLITAALHGKTVILDGLHRIHPSTLAIIYRLVHDRELQLYDGKRLLRADRYDEIKIECDKTDNDMSNSGIYRIHPSFKIVALAEPPIINGTAGQWLNSEILNLFIFHEMRHLEKNDELHIIKEKYGEPNESLLKIMSLVDYLRSSSDSTLQSLAGSLSTRQLLRIAARMNQFPDDDAYNAVYRACLARFLPPIPKQALEDSLRKFNILRKTENTHKDIHCIINKDTVTIGKTTVRRYKTKALTKVPDILFYNVPQHLILLEALLQDFELGQNLLLIGNQGVGKNKIADRLLQVLNRPREYIQLHRDTTVQTLTVQPMVRDGVVVYEDSPLIRAVKLGHVLVVDEADKAPTQVTCILKTLVETGQMILSDGRRIVSNLLNNNEYSSNIIPMHPDFRMVVLANRPGFPFLGNDFFGAIGDLFSTFAVDNPSIENEIELLKQYGPDVDEVILHKLVKVFGELRNISDQGLVSYPYSTREVVNIVKHLQKFPNEPLGTVMRNVFDFDQYSQEVFDTVVQVVHKYGIPLGTSLRNVSISKEIPLPEYKLHSTWNVHSSFHVISNEAKCLIYKPIKSLKQNTVPLDKIEVRSSFFSEQKSYWKLPMNELSVPVALSVNSGLHTDDNIRILTANPLCLFDMTLQSENLRKFNLKGLIKPLNNQWASYNLTIDRKGHAIIYEGTSNTLISINPETGDASKIMLSSLLDTAGERISNALKNRKASWELKTDLMKSHNQLVFFTPNSNQIQIIDLVSMYAVLMTFPFKVNSLVVMSPERWLIQDTLQEQYVFDKNSAESPYPNILKKIDRSNERWGKLGFLSTCSRNGLTKELLSSVLNQKVDSPNRLIATNDTYACIIVGFPNSDGLNKIFTISRDERMKNLTDPIITKHGQIIRIISSSNILPPNLQNEMTHQRFSGYIEITDCIRQKLRYIPIPDAEKINIHNDRYYNKDNIPFLIAPTSNDNLVTLDVAGYIRLWETSLVNLENSFKEWKRMVDDGDEGIQLTKERYSNSVVNEPKHGKVDPNNEPHVGGNTWAGGTGGRDTAGLGGKGGPYRLDAGHTVHQLTDTEKAAMPEHVKKAAREMGLRAFKQRLKNITMSEYDYQVYMQYSSVVQKEIQALRVTLSSLQAKSCERQWCRHQTSGDLDDTKLIEGLTGEKAIYRRRAVKEPEIGVPQIKPKRLKLVVDVSGSMYRFNGYDKRLDRVLEACIMMMEAFSGYENKFQYDIVGHSGDHYNISFVDHTKPPKNNKERLEVIQTMHAHSQFCNSGDYTLEATKYAISTLSKEDSDESIVVVLSDANFSRYGIKPEIFANILISNADVNAYAIFIGSLGDSAVKITNKIPSGKAFVCLDLKNIPRILQQIFAASVLNSTGSRQ